VIAAAIGLVPEVECSARVLGWHIFMNMQAVNNLTIVALDVGTTTCFGFVSQNDSIEPLFDALVPSVIRASDDVRADSPILSPSKLKKKFRWFCCRGSSCSWGRQH
jgi:hypothetical protein